MADATILDIDIDQDSIKPHMQWDWSLENLDNDGTIEYLNSLRPGLGNKDNKLKSYYEEEDGDRDILFVLHVKSLDPYEEEMTYKETKGILRTERVQTLLFKDKGKKEVMKSMDMEDIIKMIDLNLSKNKNVKLYLHSIEGDEEEEEKEKGEKGGGEEEESPPPAAKPFIGRIALLEFKARRPCGKRPSPSETCLQAAGRTWREWWGASKFTARKKTPKKSIKNAPKKSVKTFKKSFKKAPKKTPKKSLKKSLKKSIKKAPKKSPKKYVKKM